MITIPITVKESENSSCQVSVQLLKKTKTATKQEEKTASILRNEIITTLNNYKEKK